MKSINILMQALLLSVLFWATCPAAVVVFQDDFESQPLGVLGGNVPVGLAWLDGTPGEDSEFVVAGPEPVQGTRSLKVVRSTADNEFPARYGQGLAASAVGGYSVTYRWDIYRPAATDAPEVYVTCGDIPIAGWMVENAGETAPDGRYWIQQNGVFQSTDLAASVGAWDTVEMVVHLVSNNDPNNFTLGGTYDFYVTQGAVRTQLAAGYNLVSTSTSSGIAYFWIHGKPQMTTAANIVYFDNISVEKAVTEAPPACGDAAHPIMDEDVNGDCRINLQDVALLGQNWLACTFACDP